MTNMNIPCSLLSVACLTVAVGCREEPLLDRLNLLPEAQAGEDITVQSQGEPVTVTLDASASSDKDGEIVAYHWFSAVAAADGGVSVIEGEEPTWPEDSEQPSVVLPPGVWTFALWVEDDKGAVSLPDTVKVTVGNPDPLADPEVAACVQQVTAEASDSCKACVCSVSDACRDSVIVCDQVCWNLITCVDANCPDFDAMAADGDFSCLLQYCAEFGAGGVAAMAAAPCVTGCATCQ
jgi:hypothetical protein